VADRDGCVRLAMVPGDAQPAPVVAQTSSQKASTCLRLCGLVRRKDRRASRRSQRVALGAIDGGQTERWAPLSKSSCDG
jgi:hypothetical protein